MAHSLIGMELDNGDVLIKFTRTAAETDGALHVQEARYAPHSRPPPIHCHPAQDERFVIVEGSLLFWVDGDERIVAAGEEIAVPRGAFHQAHNPHDAPVLAIWETRPALRTAQFFLEMNRAAAGKAKPPLLDALAILKEFQDEFRLYKPPVLVQKVLFSCLAPFGRRPDLRGPDRAR